MISLGIEGTAEKTGIGIVNQQGKILASQHAQLIPQKGGIHPREAAEHHNQKIPQLITQALQEAQLTLKDIDLISFAQGPGLGPCLRTIATAARTLSLALQKPIIGVNHCIGHIEIGNLLGNIQHPVTLYVSGGNTQIISYENQKYQIFGETQDIAIGNCLDQFARETGLGHPGGPKIEKLAKKGTYTPLPYTVKGMDLSFSGLLTAAIQQHTKHHQPIENICHSLQETAFSMLTEVTERALSNTGNNNLLLVGGVAANKRLQEMLQTMADQRNTTFYTPPQKYCGDNGAMIAWLGILTHTHNNKTQKIENTTIKPKYRTDTVPLPWTQPNNNTTHTDSTHGAEAIITQTQYLNTPTINKTRIKKNYRIPEIDTPLREKRTRQEARLLHQAKKTGTRTPIIYDINNQTHTITLEKIEGTILKNHQNPETYKKLGKTISQLHNNQIIHGDLTTNNIIITPTQEIVIIDFGLGKQSPLNEDKSMDLIVLKKSLQTENKTPLFQEVLKEYQKNVNYNTTKYIEEIEKRGRYNIRKE